MCRTGGPCPLNDFGNAAYHLAHRITLNKAVDRIALMPYHLENLKP
jgi:hypothetical protein